MELRDGRLIYKKPWTAYKNSKENTKKQNKTKKNTKIHVSFSMESKGS